MTLPNFLIIGDLKAGTTSFYSYLKQHPDVYMPPGVKELRYFAFDKENAYHACAKSTVVRTLDEYLSYFENCGNAKAIGEASPNYLRSPGAAERIQQQIPGAKLIVCLRNPADRLHSVHQMAYRNGTTKLPFDEYVFGYDSAWIKANFYWLDLNRYYQRFPRHQIHVIVFDDLKQNPQKTIRDVYEFLGVDTAFEPDLTEQNTGGMPKNAVVYKLFENMRILLKQTGLSSKRFRGVSARFRKKLLAPVKLDPIVRRQILEICKDDIQRTQDLIGRDLSIWLQ